MRLLIGFIIASVSLRDITAECPPQHYGSRSRNLVCSEEGLTRVPAIPESEILKLDLSSNKIQTINGNDLRNLSEIILINLSYNELRIVSKYAFTEQRNLQEVDMSFNYLYYLHRDTFANNNKLSKLYLKNTFISFQFDVPFLNSRSLRYLDVSFCNITSIHKATLVELPNLTELDMEGNCITDFGLDVSSLMNLNLLHFNCNLCSKEAIVEQCINELAPWVTHSSESTTSKELAVAACLIVIFTLTVAIATAYLKVKNMKNTAKPEGGNPELEQIIKRKEIIRRSLPEPPLPNDGYESPIIPYYMSLTRSKGSLLSHNIILVSSKATLNTETTAKQICSIEDNTNYTKVSEFKSVPTNLQTMENGPDKFSEDRGEFCHSELSSNWTTKGTSPFHEEPSLRKYGKDAETLCTKQTPIHLSPLTADSIQSTSSEVNVNSEYYLMPKHFDFKERKLFGKIKQESNTPNSSPD